PVRAPPRPPLRPYTTLFRSFSALGAEVAVVVAYGLLLPKPVLEAPEHGCLNLHGSLLPRWRGAAPIQRAIMAGDTSTAASVMKIDRKSTRLNSSHVKTSYAV